MSKSTPTTKLLFKDERQIVELMEEIQEEIEEVWGEAVEACPDHPANERPGWPFVVDQLDSLRSRLRRETLPISDVKLFFILVYDVASRHLSKGAELNLTEFAAKLMAKHRLYGAEPLLAWGVMGILIRIDSKLQRYLNLLSQGSTGTADESIEDTVRDILGYCVLGIEIAIVFP